MDIACGGSEPRGRSAARVVQAVLLILLALCLAAPAAADGLPHVIGVLAYRPKPVTLARWQPTAEYLAAAIPGERFTIEALDYPELEKAIATRRVDFVLTNPGHYVLMMKRNGLALLATLIGEEGGQPVVAFGGVILVPAGREDIQALVDLRGKVVATPDLHSAGGYEMQAYELSRAGLQMPGDVRLLVTGMPQDTAVAALLDGRADAAFVRTGLLEAMAREGRLDAARLRVINRQAQPGFPYVLSTRLYPEWAFTALTHVDHELAGRVAAALYTLPHDSRAARLGGYHGWTIPADYEPVRAVLEELRLPPFERAPEFTPGDVAERYGGLIVVSALLVLALVVLAMRLAMLNRHLKAARRKSEAQAEERERLLAAIGEGVYGVDVEGRCTFANPAALAMLGSRAEEVLGADHHALFHHHHPDGSVYPSADCPVRQTVVDGTPRQTDGEWLLRRDGSGFPAALVVTPIGGERPGAVVAFRDLTEQKRMEAELQRLATTDFLTGLPNRRRFLEELEQELARAARSIEAPPAAVLMLDLDHFKAVNDSYGHAVGDRVLQHFSALLRDSLRKTDTPGRLGGEEFGLLLPGTPLENATILAERVRQALAASPVVVGEAEIRITISIGVTALADSDVTPDTVLARADAALYRAKTAGRDRVEAMPPGPPGPPRLGRRLS